MQRLKLWQAIVIAMAAIGVAAGVFWRSYTLDKQDPPMPAPMSGPPPGMPAIK